MTQEPHLSPQYYELTARQHVLDRTRVLVEGDIHRQRSQEAWGKSLRRLNKAIMFELEYNVSQSVLSLGILPTQ